MSFFLTTAAASFRVQGGGGEPSQYLINILSPAEGEVSTDFTMTATDNQNTISIKLTEGQEVGADFTITFE